MSWTSEKGGNSINSDSEVFCCRAEVHLGDFLVGMEVWQGSVEA
jgi:hypothetical protein